MDKKSNPKELWKGSPSAFVYVTSYFVALIVIIVSLSLQRKLVMGSGLSHVPLGTFIFHYMFSVPLGQWPLFHMTFLSTMFLQIVMWGAFLHSLYKAMLTKFTTYIVTEEEIIVRKILLTGLVSEHTELYRLIDFTLLQPIPGMVFRFSNLHLQSTDQSHPTLMLDGVTDGQSILRLIREQTERCRMQKGVREFTSAAPY